MQKKTIAMMLATGCAITMLTGCGVPQEEHDAQIAELQTANQEVVDQLNGKLVDMESLLKSEKTKLRKSRIELDNASEEIKSINQKQTDASKQLATEKTRAAKAERELTSAKSRIMAAQDETQVANDKLAETEEQLADMTRRFEQFRTNMQALSSPAPTASSSVEEVADIEVVEFAVETEPATTRSALDILNEMSAE